MTISRVFRVSPVRPCHQQIPGDRHLPCAWHTERAEQDGGKIRPGPDGLQLGHVSEIRLRDPMREDAYELLIVRPLKQPGRDREFAAARIGGMDVRIIHQPDADLLQRDRVIHLLQ